MKDESVDKHGGDGDVQSENGAEKKKNKKKKKKKKHSPEGKETGNCCTPTKINNDNEILYVFASATI